MSKIINFNARTGADYQGDDTATSDTNRLAALSFKSQATEGIAVQFSKTVSSSPTVAVVQFDGTSVASGPIFDFINQSFVSCTTILFTTGGTAGTGAIRVSYGANFGWIPILPSAAVTGAARG